MFYLDGLHPLDPIGAKPQTANTAQSVGHLISSTFMSRPIVMRLVSVVFVLDRMLVVTLKFYAN